MLLDGDLASNNGGWQWAASTGTDAQPYFRVFNPVAQSLKCDPDGAYLRRYVTELAKVKGKGMCKCFRYLYLLLVFSDRDSRPEYGHCGCAWIPKEVSGPQGGKGTSIASIQGTWFSVVAYSFTILYTGICLRYNCHDVIVHIEHASSQAFTGT